MYMKKSGTSSNSDVYTEFTDKSVISSTVIITIIDNFLLLITLVFNVKKRKGLNIHRVHTKTRVLYAQASL